MEEFDKKCTIDDNNDEEYAAEGSRMTLTITDPANGFFGNEVFTKTMTASGGMTKKQLENKLGWEAVKHLLSNGYDFKYEIPCIVLTNYNQENSNVLSTIRAILSFTEFNQILLMEKISVRTPLPKDTLVYHYLRLFTLDKVDKQIDKFLEDKQNQSKEGDGNDNEEEMERLEQKLNCSKNFTQIIGSIVEAMRFSEPRIDTIEHCVSRFLERMEEDLNIIGWFNVVSQMFSIRATDGQPVNCENRYLHKVIVDNNNKDHSLTRIAGEQGLFGEDVIKKEIFVVQIVKRSQELDPNDPIRGFLTPVNGLDVLQTTEVNDGTQQSIEYKLQYAIGFEAGTEFVDNKVIPGKASAYSKIDDKWLKITDHNIQCYDIQSYIQSSDSKEVSEKARVLFYTK